MFRERSKDFCQKDMSGHRNGEEATLIFNNAEKINSQAIA